jgi:hypothetical protein
MMINPVEFEEDLEDEDDVEGKTPSKHKRKPRATMYVTPKDARYLRLFHL